MPVPDRHEDSSLTALIRHLYLGLGEVTGGPLHVVLDDGNVADHFLVSDDSLYEYLFDGSFERWAQPGDDVSDERKQAIKETCESILAALRQMPESTRRAAIRAADVWGK